MGSSAAFERNDGQADADVLFLSRGASHTLLVGRAEAVLVLEAVPAAGPPGAPDPRPRVVRMRLRGSRLVASATGLQELPGRSNYLLGRDPSTWHTGVPRFARIALEQVLPGVDLVYHHRQGPLEYDLHLAPGVDPQGVLWEVTGIDDAEIDLEGDLRMSVGPNVLVHRKPEAFQEGHGREICVGYLLKRPADSEAPWLVGLDVGNHDPTIPLVIDPVLEYATYFGGNFGDSAYGIATDAAGNMYVAGTTTSTNFPVRNPYQGGNAGQQDAFVSKIAPDGVTLLYSTYLGGSLQDAATGICVEPGGAATIVGYTYSSNFPMFNALDGGLGGAIDAWVTKLDPSGTVPVFSTYLGGSASDTGYSCAVDAAGEVYVTGETSSDDFPLANPLQGPLPFGDAFVTKLDAQGSAYVYSTYLGGSQVEYGQDIAVDNQGSAFVTGWTSSSDFPIVGATQPTLSGTFDAFIIQLSPSGASATFSTFLGGSGTEIGEGIAVDGAGSVYVTGLTDSSDFPTQGAFQGVLAGGEDAFVTKVDPGVPVYVYSTYLGGSGDDGGFDVAAGEGGECHVAGSTRSVDFPRVNAVQAPPRGLDAFLSVVEPAGGALVLSTSLGGSSQEDGLGIAVGGRDAYVVGYTASTDFPTAAPWSGSLEGAADAFIVRIGSIHADAYVLGEGHGQPNGNRVRVFEEHGFATPVDFYAYSAGQWGTNVGCGELDGGAHEEILAGPGPGPAHGPHVRGFRRDGSSMAKVSYFAYGTLKFGVGVSSAELESDGYDEVLTAPGPGAVFGPHVRGWDVDGGSAVPIAKVSFFAYGTLRYGANAGSGDVDGDRMHEILTGPGPGPSFSATIRGFNYDGVIVASIPTVRFDAYTLLFGARVAGGDVDVDGFDEIATAPGDGPPNPPRFKGFDVDGGPVAPLAGFDATPFSWVRYGGRVALGDIDTDGAADLVCGAGPDAIAVSTVRALAYDGTILSPIAGTPIDPFGGLYGASVATGSLGY